MHVPLWGAEINIEIDGACFGHGLGETDQEAVPSVLFFICVKKQKFLFSVTFAVRLPVWHKDQIAFYVQL